MVVINLKLPLDLQIINRKIPPNLQIMGETDSVYGTDSVRSFVEDGTDALNQVEPKRLDDLRLIQFIEDTRELAKENRDDPREQDLADT
jgi:hypothetical protein